MLEIFVLNSTVTLLNYWIHNWWPHVVTTCADHVWWLHVEPTCSVLTWWPLAVTTDGEKMCGDHVVTRCGWQHVVTMCCAMCSVHMWWTCAVTMCSEHVWWPRVWPHMVTMYPRLPWVITTWGDHVQWAHVMTTWGDHVWNQPQTGH